MGIKPIEKKDLLHLIPVLIILFIGVGYLFYTGVFTWDLVKETFGIDTVEKKIEKIKVLKDVTKEHVTRTVVETLPD